MSPAGNLDWLYHLLGYTLAAAGMLFRSGPLLGPQPRAQMVSEMLVRHTRRPGEFTAPLTIKTDSRKGQCRPPTLPLGFRYGLIVRRPLDSPHDRQGQHRAANRRHRRGDDHRRCPLGRPRTPVKYPGKATNPVLPRRIDPCGRGHVLRHAPVHRRLGMAPGGPRALWSGCSRSSATPS
jgi:hypothetical protein